MKKKILLIPTLVLILALCLSFASCRQKAITGLEIVEGLKYNLTVGETPDYSEIKVNVLYNDGTSVEVGKDDLQFSELDTSTAGTKKLTITYGESSTTVNITVSPAQGGGNTDGGGDTGDGDGDNTGDGGEDIVDVGYTVFSVDYDKNLKAFLAEEGNKKNFRGEQFDNYVVGNINAFKFTLSLNVVDKVLGPAIVTVYESTSKVYLIEGANETLLEGAALAQYVTIDETAGNNTFDFTDAAAGKVFRIETAPKYGYDEADIAYNTKSLTVEVVNAYNVYHEWELNLVSNGTLEKIGGPSGNITVGEAAAKFLNNHGIERPENLAGIVIHKNLSLEVDDLPPELFYTLDKDVDYTYTDANGAQQTGTWTTGTQFFYDVIGVYDHLFSDEAPEFSIHGNYFTIYTNQLPCVAPKGYGYNENDLSGADLFKFDTPNDLIVKNGHQKYIANMSNLYLRDDDGSDNDNSASMRHMLGLVGVKTFKCVSNYDQVNIHSYFLSIHANRDCQTVNINDCDLYNAWNNHIMIWSDNYIDGDSSTTIHANHTNITVNVTGASRVAKCGGPAIINMVHGASYHAQSESIVDVNLEAGTVVYSYVTGTEAWFIANNATGIATMIKSLNGALAPGGGSFLTKLPGSGDTLFFNAIMVNMKYVSDGGSVFSNDDLDGTFSIGGLELLDMNDSQYGNYGNPYVSGYASHAMLGKAPIFHSSNGTVGAGIIGTDQGLNAFNPDPSKLATGMVVTQMSGYPVVVPNGAYQAATNEIGLAPADASLYEGEYITMYYNNLGLVFGYNESPDTIPEY